MIASYINLLPGTAPATPAAGRAVLYTDASGILNVLLPDGISYPLGGNALAGRTADLALSAAGTTDLAPATKFIQWFQKVTAAAGAGAYVANLTLDSAKAFAGAIFRINIEFAASTNPTINIYDNTTGGTLLKTVTNPDATARYYAFAAAFDGTNWQCIDGHFLD